MGGGGWWWWVWVCGGGGCVCVCVCGGGGGGGGGGGSVILPSLIQICGDTDPCKQRNWGHSWFYCAKCPDFQPRHNIKNQRLNKKERNTRLFIICPIFTTAVDGNKDELTGSWWCNMTSLNLVRLMFCCLTAPCHCIAVTNIGSLSMRSQVTFVGNVPRHIHIIFYNANISREVVTQSHDLIMPNNSNVWFIATFCISKYLYIIIKDCYHK